MTVDCLGCGRSNGGAMSINGGLSGPEPGSVALCIYCSSIAVFTEDGFREPTAEEFGDIMRSPDMLEAIYAVRMARESGSFRG